MKRIGLVGVACSLIVMAVIVAGAVTLSRPTAAALRPDCGPSYVWDCRLPSGTHTTVGGTRCDIAAYQRRTGATCVPSGL